MLKADLHVHSYRSIDSSMSYEQLIKACQHKGITCIAVADHGTTLGARELSRIAPLKIIICEEIMTPFGEIMGMFLKEDIPDRIPVMETLHRIKEQDGLVCIPHPFDLARPSAFRNLKEMENIMDSIDIIEVFNSRSLYPAADKKAAALAKRYRKVMSAGTDAHSPSEIGYVNIEMKDFNNSAEFLTSLSTARISGKKSNILVHLLSTRARLGKQNQKR